MKSGRVSGRFFICRLSLLAPYGSGAQLRFLQWRGRGGSPLPLGGSKGALLSYERRAPLAAFPCAAQESCCALTAES